MQQQLGHSPETKPPGMLSKLLTLVVAVAVITLGLLFSMLILAVALGVGLIVGGYMWWKTRDLRKTMDEQGGAVPPEGGGRIIEGEAVRERDEP